MSLPPMAKPLTPWTALGSRPLPEYSWVVLPRRSKPMAPLR